MSPHETPDGPQNASGGAERPPKRPSASEPAETPTDAADGRTEPRAGGVSARTGPDDTTADDGPECALPDFMACDCNHIDGCQHPATPHRPPAASPPAPKES